LRTSVSLPGFFPPKDAPVFPTAWFKYFDIGFTLTKANWFKKCASRVRETRLTQLQEKKPTLWNDPFFASLLFYSVSTNFKLYKLAYTY
jgi:hypothetical protein